MADLSASNPMKLKIVDLDGQRSFVMDSNDFDLSTAYLDIGLKGVGYNESTRSFWASTDYFFGENFTLLLAKICKAHGFALNHENLIACLDTMRTGLIVNGSDIPKSRIGAYLPAIILQMPDKKSDGPLLQSFYNEIEQLAQARMLALSEQNQDKKGSDGEKSKLKVLQEQIDYLSLKNSNLQRQLQESSALGVAQTFQTGSEGSAELMLGKIQDIDTDNRLMKVRAGGKSLTLQFEELSYLPTIGQTCAIYLDAQVRPHKLIMFRSEQTPAESVFKRAKVLAQRDDIVKFRTEDGEIWQVIRKDQEERLQSGRMIIAHFHNSSLLRIINIAALRRTDELVNLAFIELLRISNNNLSEPEEYLDADFEVYSVDTKNRKTVNS